MLSYVFVIMIVCSVVCAVVFGTADEINKALMSGASDAVQLIISMCGMMCLWSGVMEVAKESGLTKKLSNLLSPLLKRLFPDVKKDSLAFEKICMNVSANLLGLSNAATPLGLSAMKELKKGSSSDIASDSMITFVLMNTASIQILPTTVAVLRQAKGSQSPFDIIVCVWVTSVVALTLAMILSKILCAFRVTRLI